MASNQSYAVTLAPAAARDIRGLTQGVQRRIITKLEALQVDARPPGTEKLAGQSDLYRVRVGDYRIVYQIDDKARIVTITQVGHRRDVYLR